MKICDSCNTREARFDALCNTCYDEIVENFEGTS